MQACNCSNSYKYKSACVVCGAPWKTKNLKNYISELKRLSEEMRIMAFENNDLELRNKYCLLRDVYTELEDIERNGGK